jgi:hypothetical protein
MNVSAWTTGERATAIAGLVAVAMEIAAVALLSQDIPGNSALWFPINTLYFGGILVAVGAGIAGLSVLFSSRRPRALLAALVLGAIAVLLFRATTYR